MRSSSVAAFLVSAISQTRAAFDLGFYDDSDLTSFVTRPEIKAPVFNVSIYEPEALAPGYWFVAPYAHIRQEHRAKKYYQPCQTGPQIYDDRGNLVWSGACTVRNQNTCDFRAWRFNDTYYMSALLTSDPNGNDSQGHGIIMNSSYDIVDSIYVPPTIREMNMHELNLINDGNTALHIVGRAMFVDVSDLDVDVNAGWVLDMGFREVDIVTGDTLFQWWAHDGNHVSLSESQRPIENLDGPYPSSWNWFHANSIEKNAEGDYLFNSRYTDTIFKVSGKDGSIIWRLGGNKSSFTQDFNFSRQHDVRWVHQDETTETISFLNNGADEESSTWNHSAALIVELDKSAMTAQIINQIDRPDGKLSRLRGNYQPLANGNAFVCWSENSYISEHGPDGRLLMEAKFLSKRFVTYRGYKFDYVGRPKEDPIAKGFVYGTTPATSTTVVYVSWNGATEVVAWRFYGSDSAGNRKMLGEKRKTGFETMFQAPGYYSDVFAEAIDASGSVLRLSPSDTVVTPPDWDSGMISHYFDEDWDHQQIIQDEHEFSTANVFVRATALASLISKNRARFFVLFAGGVSMTAWSVYCCRGRRYYKLRRGLTHAVSKSAC